VALRLRQGADRLSSPDALNPLPGNSRDTVLIPVAIGLRAHVGVALEPDMSIERGRDRSL
jgi:hypothetical protein